MIKAWTICLYVFWITAFFRLKYSFKKTLPPFKTRHTANSPISHDFLISYILNANRHPSDVNHPECEWWKISGADMPIIIAGYLFNSSMQNAAGSAFMLSRNTNEKRPKLSGRANTSIEANKHLDYVFVGCGPYSGFELMRYMKGVDLGRNGRSLCNCWLGVFMGGQKTSTIRRTEWIEIQWPRGVVMRKVI